MRLFFPYVLEYTQTFHRIPMSSQEKAQDSCTYSGIDSTKLFYIIRHIEHNGVAGNELINVKNIFQIRFVFSIINIGNILIETRCIKHIVPSLPMYHPNH